MSGASDPVKKKNGIADIPSNHSVDDTVERVKNMLQIKEITLFALIDPSGEAEKVGMKMRPTSQISRYLTFNPYFSKTWPGIAPLGL